MTTELDDNLVRRLAQVRYQNMEVNRSQISNNAAIRPPKVKHHISFLSGIALMVSTMIGSGIFISPGRVVESVDSVWVSLAVWLFCGLICLGGALCYVELESITTKSGGEHAYLMEAFGSLHHFFGPVPAFLFQWASILILRPASLAIVLLVFSKYVTKGIYGSSSPPDTVIMSSAIIALFFLTVVNCWSSEAGTKVQNFITMIQLSACLIIIVGGLVNLAKGDTKNFEGDFSNGHIRPSALVIAFYNGLWAYNGWNALTYCTAELENPYKNLPRAITIAIPSVTVIYLLINIAYFTVLSPSVMVNSPTVAVTWANIVMPSVAMFVPYVISISALGSANGMLFSASRLCVAAAKHGHCPAILAMIHRGKQTPIPALISLSSLTAGLIIAADIGQLIDYFSITMWLFYALTFSGLLTMRWTKRRLPRRFKVPILVPITVLLISGYLVIMPIIENPHKEYMYSFLFLFVGVLVYIPVYRKDRLEAFQAISRKLENLLNVAHPYVK